MSDPNTVSRLILRRKASRESELSGSLCGVGGALLGCDTSNTTLGKQVPERVAPTTARRVFAESQGELARALGAVGRVPVVANPVLGISQICCTVCGACRNIIRALSG